MTTTYPLAASVTLDGSGNGTATIAPRGSGMSTITRTTVSVATAVKMPIAQTFINVATPPNLVDATYTGANDSSDTTIPLQPGSQLLCVWSGGDAGALATVTCQITQE